MGDGTMIMKAQVVVRAIAFILVAAVGLALVPSPAFSGPRAHDGGVFLRLSGGVGYASTKVNLPTLFGSDQKFSGMSGDGNFAIGGIIANNLALHGTLWGWGMSDPTVESGSESGKADGDLSMGAAGGGVTYYFMPANIYLSGSIGIGVMSSGDESTDPGFASDITLGKEWWVGSKWGLGVAGAFGYHTIPGIGSDVRWKGTSVAVRFTATLN
jgi:hypothetical protein